MNQRNSIREVLWVVGIFVITFVFLYFYSESTIFTDDYIKIAEDENPLYLRPWIFLLFTFFILLLITFFIKEAIIKFRDLAGNIILSLALVGNIITISVFIKNLSFSYTIYPPLSALQVENENLELIMDKLFPALICVQFLLAAALLLVGIRIGTLSKHRPTTTPGWRD